MRANRTGRRRAATTHTWSVGTKVAGRMGAKVVGPTHQPVIANALKSRRKAR